MQFVLRAIMLESIAKPLKNDMHNSKPHLPVWSKILYLSEFSCIWLHSTRVTQM